PVSAGGFATARLECKASTAVEVRVPEITAIGAGTLSNQMVGGGIASWGSGEPVIRSRWNNGPVGVGGTSPGDFVPHTEVASLALGPGNWFISAKLYATASDGQIQAEQWWRCQLQAGSQIDEASPVLSFSGSSGSYVAARVAPVELQMT